MDHDVGEIYQINVKPETVGERGLPKRPVDSVTVTRAGLVGDFNRYRHEEEHDNAKMAVLIMPLEMIQQLNSEGWPIKPGDLGENFTTKGIAYEKFAVEKKYAIGEAIVQISKVCDPCSNLYQLPYVGKTNSHFVKTMTGRRGWYATVEREGLVRKGDQIKQL